MSFDLEFAQSCISQIVDYPVPGVIFKDVTPIAANAVAFNSVLGAIESHFSKSGVTHIVGIEARGFIFGAALAARMGLGFIPIRKSGKLPRQTHRVEYALEYGNDAIEIHTDALKPNDVVLVIDDVLATGGTACAALDLISQCGAKAESLVVLLNLEFLGGQATVNRAYPEVEIFTLFPDA